MLVVCDERTKKILMLIVDALVALECVGCQNQQAKGEILRHVDGAKINLLSEEKNTKRNKIIV
jgi:hypothetical protein